MDPEAFNITVKGCRGRNTFITAAERIRNIALHVLCALRLAPKHMFTAALHKIRQIITLLPTGIWATSLEQRPVCSGVCF
jgi:hypothetical protein